MLLTAGAARARTSTNFLFDGVAGVAVPIADGDYRDGFYPWPKIGLRIGAEIWFTPRIALAPELALDGGPLIGQRSAGLTTGKFRCQPGARLLFGFGQGHAFFLHYLIGAELFVFGPGGRGGAGTLNLGFATEPGGGMQFKIGRRTVAGFMLGFPIGMHTYGSPITSTNADFDVSGFIGLRI
jgi:hypothetical protein